MPGQSWDLAEDANDLTGGSGPTCGFGDGTVS